jgi:hypothetical protein
MMKSATLFVLLVLGTLALPCRAGEVPAATKAILEKAEQIEVYSLWPANDKEKGKEFFHEYPILGKVVVKDAKTRKALIAAIEKGAKENEGVAANCFMPRHGVRATAGGKTLELVICFQCLQVKGYLGDKADAGFLISKSPEPTFDKILKDAGVKLAPKD